MDIGALRNFYVCVCGGVCVRGINFLNFNITVMVVVWKELTSEALGHHRYILLILWRTSQPAHMNREISNKLEFLISRENFG